MNVIVSLLDPPYTDLTYTLPDKFFPVSFWKVGQRVAVPLGMGRLRAGIIRTLTEEAPEGVRLKPVAWPLETESIVSADLLALLMDVAVRQCMQAGAAIAQLIPMLTDTSATIVRPHAEDKKLRSIAIPDIRRLPEPFRKTLAGEILAGESYITPPHADTAATERCVLACDAPWPIRPSAHVQRSILEYLAFHGAVNRQTLLKELKKDAATATTALTLLVQRGFIRIEKTDDEDSTEAINDALLAPRTEKFELTDAQRAAVDDFAACLKSNQPAHRLLYGVTGSGKTAVYLETTRVALSLGRSVILLAPEVALAHKLRRDVEQALPGVPVYFYHGYQGRPRREKLFRAIARQQGPCIVVGTRSSLFLPVKNLGMIILDEEHDASYKQEDRAPYQAKEIAWFRSTHEKALLLLGSATPDIRTWYAVQTGHLPVLHLPCRISGRDLPPVELVDISAMRSIGNEDIQLAQPCIDALRQNLADGNQSIILLNRRGFAPLVYCADCRKTLTCPHCSVGLAYHRREGRLLCHYCGYSVPFPAPCPTCHAMNYLPIGEGTERLAEHLEEKLGARVLRLDRDSVRRVGALEEILSSFAQQKADILVGTQMLSKGHHFPNVTLAIIADGDLSLSFPDYRAAEHTFQLLVQSAGRAGRGEKPGHVLIQTRDTSHYCWKYVAKADYEGFYAEEISRRQHFRYPPFGRLSMIRLSYAREDAKAAVALHEITAVMHRAAAAEHVLLLGPAPSPLALINGRLRFQCLIKSADWLAPRSVYAKALAHPEARRLRIHLDLDPVNML